MGLPNSRDTTYTPASKIFSAILNKLQDCIIGGKRGTFARTFLPRMVYTGGQWVMFSSSPPAIGSNAAGTVVIQIPCDDGDRITGLTFRAWGDGAADLTVSVIYLTNDFVQHTLSTLSDVNRASGAWSLVTMPAFVSQVVASEATLYLIATASAANYQIALLRATFDRP